jgi:hypothetical protein
LQSPETQSGSPGSLWSLASLVTPALRTVALRTAALRTAAPGDAGPW